MSQILSITLSYTQGSQELPLVSSLTLSVTPWVCPSLLSLVFSSLMLSVFLSSVFLCLLRLLFVPQIIRISHMTQGTPEPARSTTPTGGDEIQTQQTQLNHEVTTNCIHITDKYRSGLIEKIPAILELQKAIPRDDETTYLSALAVYVKVFDRYERIHTPGGQEETDRVQAETAEPERDDRQEDTARATKRHRAPSSELDDDDSARCKISIWDLPWVTCNETSPSYLPPSLTATQSILENIS